MNETYWLAGLNAENEMDAPTAIQKLLASSAIKPRWVQAVHWVSSAEYCRQLPKDLCALIPDIPSPFCWPQAPLLDHLLLQNLIRSILLDEVELALIGQTGSQGSAAMLLSSPQAVGRYNILPSTRVESCRTFPDKVDSAILKGVPAAQRLVAKENDVVWQMNSLVQMMLAEKKLEGLLRSRAPRGSGTLVIRIELV